MEFDVVAQKKDCKRDLVRSGGSAGGKIVFALLTKVITFYIGPTAADVQGFDLKFISKSTFWYLKEYLEEVIHIFLNILGNIKNWGSKKWGLGRSSKSFRSLRGSKFVWA